MDLFKIVGWMFVVLCIGFELGMFCSKSMISIINVAQFYNGSIPETFTFNIGNDTLNLIQQRNNHTDFWIQSCSEYSEPYRSCDDRFQNRTGLYCNKTLVCQN